MNDQSTHSALIENNEDVQRRDDERFQMEADRLIKDAEETRLKYMQQHRSRGFVSMTCGLISLLAGAGGFGWFLLMEYNIIRAVACIAIAVAIPIILNLWASAPIKSYASKYKTDFMPKMAKALGGLKFHPKRGISEKIISRTGVIPAYDSYEAEDCFMGKYKGVKVLFSEARLNHGKKPVFDGVFVLLEISADIIEGHTIITADKNMVKKWAGSRWKKLQNVNVSISNPEWDRFEVYSDTPEAASLFVGERLIKELAEASDVFENSLLSAVLFKGKYVFMSIPYEIDMFEASNMHVPVTTREHAMNCKKEIEQILEVIDVFELYKGNNQVTSE